MCYWFFQSTESRAAGESLARVERFGVLLRRLSQWPILLDDAEELVVKPVRFHGAWIIRAPRDRVYTLMMNFEKWPELFPVMVKAIKVVRRNETTAVIEGDFNLVGRRGRGVMNIRLRPPSGYDADNASEELGKEKERLQFEEIPEGTLFRWEVLAEPNGVWTRLLARLFGFYVRRFYERTLIRPLRRAVED